MYFSIFICINIMHYAMNKDAASALESIKDL